MADRKFLVRVGALASALAAILLAAQIVVGIMIGPDAASLESIAPDAVKKLFSEHAREIQLMMTLDNLFIVAYLAAFVGIAAVSWERRAFAILGLSAGIIAGLFDFWENSTILGFVGQPSLIDLNALLALSSITRVKWIGAGVAAASFGVTVWDAPRLNRVTSILFLLFAPIDVWGMIGGAGSLVRIAWMLVVFMIGGVFLSSQKSKI